MCTANTALSARLRCLNKGKNSSRGERRVFTNQVLNIGDAYNPRTNQFTALIGGLYMFTVQIGKKNDDHLGVLIVEIKRWN